MGGPYFLLPWKHRPDKHKFRIQGLTPEETRDRRGLRGRCLRLDRRDSHPVPAGAEGGRRGALSRAHGLRQPAAALLRQPAGASDGRQRERAVVGSGHLRQDCNALQLFRWTRSSPSAHHSEPPSTGSYPRPTVGGGLLTESKFEAHSPLRIQQLEA